MPLVTRNHAKLTLEGARAVLASATKRAAELRTPVNIAVADDGGNLILFERMDGAKPSSISIAIVKSQASAMRRGATGPIMAGDHPNLPLTLGLAIASPALQTPIRGSAPLFVDGEIVGAIGVSGATEDQDVEIASAGAAAIEKA